MRARQTRLLFASCVSLTGLVLLAHIATINRPAPWEDEIFAVSTGLSIARARPPILSVLAQYPRTGSPVDFYGPVSFEAAAFLIRIFGLSVASWRLLCFAGVILTVLASSKLVKWAGSDKWAQLITASILAVSGSIASSLPGRWDFITSGLFLAGLLLLLESMRARAWNLLGKITLAGSCIGLSLASTPRSLTLSLAAMSAVLISAALNPDVRNKLLLRSIGIILVATLVQNLALLPWGINSFSWLSFVKRAASQDRINVTPVAGRGPWEFDLQLHKVFILLTVLLLILGVLGAVAHFRNLPDRERLWRKSFLGLFALANLFIMMILLRHALGQSGFWLPPAVIALMCWFDWERFLQMKLQATALGLILICFLLLAFQETRRLAYVILAWDRMSTANIAIFVRETVPEGAVVYGPVGGYFYPVELAGDTYLYPYEHTTPGLYSEPGASISTKIEEEICSGPTYVIWPTARQLDAALELQMPGAIESRLQSKIGEFRQPPLSRWRMVVLRSIGDIGGRYGFPDVAIYSLRSSNDCGRD